jgi:hypothetical protein
LAASGPITSGLEYRHVPRFIGGGQHAPLDDLRLLGDVVEGGQAKYGGKGQWPCRTGR